MTEASGEADRGALVALGVGVFFAGILWSIFTPFAEGSIPYWLGLVLADALGIWICVRGWKKYRPHRQSPAA